MSEKREHRQRLNARIAYAAAIERWAKNQPSRIRFFAVRRWLKEMPRKRRSPACSDRCADYQIAKAFHRAEAQWAREQVRRRQRGVNGRK